MSLVLTGNYIIDALVIKSYTIVGRIEEVALVSLQFVFHCISNLYAIYFNRYCAPI